MAKCAKIIEELCIKYVSSWAFHQLLCQDKKTYPAMSHIFTLSSITKLSILTSTYVAKMLYVLKYGLLIILSPRSRTGKVKTSQMKFHYSYEREEVTDFFSVNLFSVNSPGNRC